MDFASKVFFHHSTASLAAPRARAAREKFARGAGKNVLPIIAVMTAGETTYWEVSGDLKIRAIISPSNILGSVMLRVFDYTGENDQALVEVGDHP